MHLDAVSGLNAAQLDSSYFVGNAPDIGRLSGHDGGGDRFEVPLPTDQLPNARYGRLPYSLTPGWSFTSTAAWCDCDCSAA